MKKKTENLIQNKIQDFKNTFSSKTKIPLYTYLWSGKYVKRAHFSVCPAKGAVGVYK
jgi:hypothetical protein